MRVVAGTARGRRLRTAPGLVTRPTADRVREATFNALGSLGVLDGATVVDLFAGSGALGIEALSRGAGHATFVDNDARALEVIRANLDTTDLVDRATVVRSEAIRYTADMAPVDLALLDPPYVHDDAAWQQLLGGLDAGTVVAESDREVPMPAPWRVLRSKRYGGTVVLIAQRA